MIVGVGIDLAPIGRMAQSIERFGDRILDRLFTPHERAFCDRRALAVSTTKTSFESVLTS